MAAQIVETGAAGLTQATAQVGVDHDSIADCELRDSLSQFDHPARSIGSGHMRKVELKSRPAVAGEQIHTVERYRLQPNEHLGRAVLRLGKFVVLEDFGTAVLVEVNRAHVNDASRRSIRHVECEIRRD